MIQLVCLALLLYLCPSLSLSLSSPLSVFFLFIRSMCLPLMTFYIEHDDNDDQTGKKKQVVIGSFSMDF